MLDYFPNADHAGIYAAQASRRVRPRRPGRRDQGAAGPGRPAEAAAGGPGRRRHLLRARAAAGARQGRGRPRRGRRARAEAAHLADGAPGQRDPLREGPRGQARRHGRHPLPVRLPADDRREGRRRPRLGQGDQRRLQLLAPADRQARRRDARRVLELRGHRPRAPRQGPRDPQDGRARRARLRRAGLRRPQGGPRRGRRLAHPPLPAGHRARAPDRSSRTRTRASTRC